MPKEEPGQYKPKPAEVKNDEKMSQAEKISQEKLQTLVHKDGALKILFTLKKNELLQEIKKISDELPMRVGYLGTYFSEPRYYPFSGVEDLPTLIYGIEEDREKAQKLLSDLLKIESKVPEGRIFVNFDPSERGIKVSNDENYLDLKDVNVVLFLTDLADLLNIDDRYKEANGSSGNFFGKLKTILQKIIDKKVPDSLVELYREYDELGKQLQGDF